MPKKKPQNLTARAIKDILRQYKGLTVSVHSVRSALGDVGLVISRPTVRKYLLLFGCVDDQMGLYNVPKRLTQSTQESANEQQPTA